MDKRWKRSLALLMTVVMLLGILPTAAFAAEDEPAGGNPPPMTETESADNSQLGVADDGEDSQLGAEQATPQSEGTSKEVYLNGVSGNDINDGSSTDTAVKTFARAKELLAKDGIIYITGPVTVTGTETWSLEGYGDAKVMRYGDTDNPEGFTSDMVKLESYANLTLEHIVIDGNRAAIDEETQHWGGTIIGCDYDTTSCSLTLNRGCVLQNNYGQQMGSAISGLSHMTLIMNEGAVIQNNSTDGAHYGGGVFLANDSTFTMNGGEIKNNEGNRGGGVALICSDMTMNGGTISGNKTYPVLSGSDGYGGGIYIADYAAISGSPGIEEISPGKATFTMKAGSITGNTAQNYGGGILAFPQGSRVASNEDITIAISDGEISGNTVTSGSGGGIAMFFDASHLNISGGEIKDNSVSTNSGYGGGIILHQVTGDENIAISGGTISGNKAWRGGGVALFAGSKATMSGIEISGNSASDGGGIYNAGTVKMSAGAISGNAATEWAGGVENAKGATFTMTGGTINSNKATKTSGDRNSIGGGVTNEGTFTMTSGTLYGNTADFAANDFYNHGDSSQSIGVVVKDAWDSIHQMEIESLSLQSGITRASGTATFTLPDPETFNMGYDAWYHDGPNERYENHPNNPFYESFSKETGEYWLTLGDPVLPPTPTQDYTVTFLPGDHGTLSGTTSYTVPSGSRFGDSGRTVPTVNEHSNYDFTGWLGSDGKTYTSSQILSLPITSDMTFTAQYKRESSGGGGGGGGTTHYILHYESNGGTEYDDERYAKNTVVDLDKVPTREGYTFTGWYADEELTERITEIKMTSNKTVYAGWEATGVPDLLNGRDHFAYVIGYADGTVRPLDNISRAEVATIIFRLLDPDVRDEYLTTNNTFEDVNEGMWCNTAISTLARLGIVYGRTSTFFDPDASITRAEFAAICARFDNSGIEADSSFTDISGHWAEDEIERAATLGWIRGYTDGTFRPNNLITRAEAMTMINRVLQRLPEDEDDLLDDMNVWPDNQPDDWYYLAVQEATNSHDFDRKSDGVHEHWTEMTADPDWKQYE